MRAGRAGAAWGRAGAAWGREPSWRVHTDCPALFRFKRKYKVKLVEKRAFREIQ